MEFSLIEFELTQTLVNERDSFLFKSMIGPQALDQETGEKSQD